MRRHMIRLTIRLAIAASAMLIAAACEGPDHVGVAVAAGGPGYYDGYYDGYYGPFNDGYWGNDGFFWYSDARHDFHRDEGRHFQRTASNGFNHVRGSGMARAH